MFVTLYESFISFHQNRTAQLILNVEKIKKIKQHIT